MKIDNRYWAGLFDGEGHIYVAADLVHMQVGVTQKETAVLYLLKNRFGGNVYSKGAGGVSVWQAFNAMDMKRFLSAVEPYVIIKAIEVKLAIEILTNWNPNNRCNGNGGRGRSLVATESERRRELRAKLYADRAEPKQEINHA